MGKISSEDFITTVLAPLHELSDCPKHLYYRGNLIPKDIKVLTVVGSRQPSAYARECMRHIMQGLAGYPICVVSGLALGSDTLAHTLALEYDIPTVSLPGSGLSNTVLYPASNRLLAEKIVASGGLLLSEFEPTARAAPWTFPKRNRLMARIADLVLVVEAGEKSGTLITARNASEYSVEVAVLPGSIFNANARGSNDLIKQGAQLVQSSDDVLALLGLQVRQNHAPIYLDVNEEESFILGLLTEPLSRDDLLAVSNYEVSRLSTTLSLLEIKGYVVEQLGLIYKK